MSTLENSQKTELLFKGVSNEKYKFTYALVRLLCKTICILTTIMRVDVSFIPDLVARFF